MDVPWLIEWYVLSELIKVDDSSRKNVCSDDTMHKCLSSFEHGGPPLSAILAPLPQTLMVLPILSFSYTFSWHQTWIRLSPRSFLSQSRQRLILFKGTTRLTLYNLHLFATWKSWKFTKDVSTLNCLWASWSH